MTARKLATWFAGCLLAAAAAAPTRVGAQQEFAAPVVDGDADLFAPVDFSFEGLPIRDEAGYFFQFDKLSWAFTGERVKMGTPNASFASLNPFRLFNTGGQIIPSPDPDDDSFIFVPGTLFFLNPPGLLGTLDSPPPRAQFAWGERYEFGYFDGETGWEFSVLDGPEARSGDLFGINTVDPLFGSVLINFDDPQGLMFGFLDVWSTPGGDGMVFNPDGFPDDIDDDGQHGPIFDLETPAWVPETRIVGSGADFEDIILLPTSWQFVDVRNATETQGFEVMRRHRLNNNHYMAKHQNNNVELSFGARYLRLKDYFFVQGFGGVMGNSFWETTVANNLVGPQIGLRWLHQRHRLLLDWNGRFLFGYNVQDFDQTASLGEDLLPGALNRPLYFPSTYSVHGKQENEFSPVAEMRVNASYQLTSNVALRLGYTAIFVDNISRASSQVRYELPRMGFREDQVSKQEIFINGLNFGFEAVY
jgi:hypothetical protein